MNEDVMNEESAVGIILIALIVLSVGYVGDVHGHTLCRNYR